MTVTRNLKINFTEDDGSKISWDNPLLKTDDAAFDFCAEFDLTKISQIIDAAAGVGCMSRLCLTASAIYGGR